MLPECFMIFSFKLEIDKTTAAHRPDVPDQSLQPGIGSAKWRTLFSEFAILKNQSFGVVHIIYGPTGLTGQF